MKIKELFGVLLMSQYVSLYNRYNIFKDKGKE